MKCGQKSQLAEGRLNRTPWLPAWFWLSVLGKSCLWAHLPNGFVTYHTGPGIAVMAPDPICRAEVWRQGWLMEMQLYLGTSVWQHSLYLQKKKAFSSRDSNLKQKKSKKPYTHRLCVKALPCTVSFAMSVLLQEKAQIRREERAKRRRRLEDINTLKSMGYSERAAQVALQNTQGNLDQAFKVNDFSVVVVLYKRNSVGVFFYCLADSYFL